ncbi:MAG: hypothetical protein R3A48_11470 [Polyangiales bacterium]
MSSSRMRALALALSVVACANAPTAIVVSVDTDAPSSLPLRLAVRVSRERDAAAAEPRTFVFRTAPGDPTLPATFTVRPDEGSSEGVAWIHLEATVGAAGGRGYVIRREASARFVPHEVVRLSLFLNAACGGAASGCTSAPPEACTQGVRCEELGLTCGDDARCISVGLDHDAGAAIDIPAIDVRTDTPTIDAAIDIPAIDALTDIPAIDAAIDIPAIDAPTDTASTDVTTPPDRVAPPVDVPVLPMDAGGCPNHRPACGTVYVDAIAANETTAVLAVEACAPAESCVASACRCVPSRGQLAATTAAAAPVELPHRHELHRRRVPLRTQLQRACGDDGCGACGSCPTGTSCTGGKARCVPSCGASSRRRRLRRPCVEPPTGTSCQA